MLRISFSGLHNSFDNIMEFVDDGSNSFRYYYSGNVISEKFSLYSKNEINSELKERLLSLETMASLDLLSMIEARFRVDFHLRCQHGNSDKLSNKFRLLLKEKGNRVSLIDDIIVSWRECFPNNKTRLDNLQKALDYRNWLAHGKYWQPKENSHILKYDYLSICALAEDVLYNLDLKNTAT